MATELNEVMVRADKTHNPCLLKTADGEPLFVLRAKDILAPILVMEWIKLARLDGTPLAKLENASLVARAMVEWANIHGAKVPD